MFMIFGEDKSTGGCGLNWMVENGKRCWQTKKSKTKALPSAKHTNTIQHHSVNRWMLENVRDENRATPLAYSSKPTKQTKQLLIWLQLGCPKPNRLSGDAAWEMRLARRKSCSSNGIGANSIRRRTSDRSRNQKQIEPDVVWWVGWIN